MSDHASRNFRVASLRNFLSKAIKAYAVLAERPFVPGGDIGEVIGSLGGIIPFIHIPPDSFGDGQVVEIVRPLRVLNHHGFHGEGAGNNFINPVRIEATNKVIRISVNAVLCRAVHHNIQQTAGGFYLADYCGALAIRNDVQPHTSHHLCSPGNSC